MRDACEKRILCQNTLSFDFDFFKKLYVNGKRKWYFEVSQPKQRRWPYLSQWDIVGPTTGPICMVIIIQKKIGREELSNIFTFIDKAESHPIQLLTRSLCPIS